MSLIHIAYREDIGRLSFCAGGKGDRFVGKGKRRSHTDGTKGGLKKKKRVQRKMLYGTYGE